jgi:hypothetical protein
MIDSFLMLVCLAVALLHVVMVTNYVIKFRIIYLVLPSCGSIILVFKLHKLHSMGLVSEE